MGEQFEGSVRDLAASGEGVVVHPDGRVLFAPGVWVGEVGIFAPAGGRRARLVRLVEPSAARLAPPCPHHGFAPGRCGGCPWQFAAPTAQLAQKERRVRRALEGLAAAPALSPARPAPAPFGWRNRARLRSDGRQIGFLSWRSRVLAPIGDCPVLTAPNRATLAALRGRLPEPDWRPRGARLTVLAIDDRTPGQVVVDGAVPFRQGNDAQNEALKAWLAGQLANDPPAFALELFAGAGNLTEVLAAAGVARVVAVEGDAAACSALGARRLPGVEVVCADLRDPARLRALARSVGEAELLLLDPPRDGFRALPALLAALPRLARILYVSCDLATFVRDAAGAAARGFALRAVQPFDFFPHTPHIELAALFER